MSTAHNFSSKSKAFVYDAIKIKSTVDQSRSFLYEWSQKLSLGINPDLRFTKKINSLLQWRGMK